MLWIKPSNPLKWKFLTKHTETCARHYLALRCTETATKTLTLETLDIAISSEIGHQSHFGEGTLQTGSDEMPPSFNSILSLDLMALICSYRRPGTQGGRSVSANVFYKAMKNGPRDKARPFAGTPPPTRMPQHLRKI